MTGDHNLQQSSWLRSATAHSWIVRLVLFMTVLLTSAAANSAVAQTSVLQGTPSLSSNNGPGERLPGASLNLTASELGKTELSTVTNEEGQFSFTNLTAGVYTLQVELQGFKQHMRAVTIRPQILTIENIELELEDLSGSVTVVAEEDELNPTDSVPQTSFMQEELQTLALANERFQDALPLVPGVVRGPDGLLNMKGGRSSQSALAVNSANVADPVTGEGAINLPIEAIQSVQVIANPYAAEYGQFTGAVTTVQTKSGGEKFAANAQSFVPKLRRRGGHLVGIAAFTPRVTFSGPVIKDKLKSLQSLEYRFVRTPVDNLPPLKRDSDLESFDSVSQFDWDIDDRNHLTTTFSLFPQKLRYVGLNTFNSQEVTPNFKQRGFLGAVNERWVVNSKSVLESTSSKYRAHFGLKVFNVTNRFNPRDFQNNLAGDHFGEFSNGVARKLGGRVVFTKK